MDSFFKDHYAVPLYRSVPFWIVSVLVVTSGFTLYEVASKLHGKFSLINILTVVICLLALWVAFVKQHGAVREQRERYLESIAVSTFAVLLALIGALNTALWAFIRITTAGK